MDVRTGEEREIVLSVRNLKKRAGGRWIIRGISFDVHAGEIFGFLGPNGSGKTTTIRMLADLIRPTEGSVAICSHDLAKERNKALAKAGFIVENPDMYPFMSGRENLRHFARMSPGADEKRIEEAVRLVGLERRIDDKVKTYSLGMRQRLGIAQALLADPRLLVLDEPTNGLDPQGIRELRRFLRQLADRGIGLLVSSHLLSEIELMCDRVAIINRGETIAVGGVKELLGQASGGVLLEVDDPKAACRLLAEAGVAAEMREREAAETPFPAVGADAGAARYAPPPRGTLAVRAGEADIPAIVGLLASRGIGIHAVERLKPTLEDLFITLTGGGHIV